MRKCEAFPARSPRIRHRNEMGKRRTGTRQENTQLMSVLNSGKNVKKKKQKSSR